MRRLVTRWSAKNNAKLLSLGEGSEQASSYQEAKKMYDAIDQSIILVRNWVQRKNMQEGIIEFKERWDLINSFLKAEPRVEFECRHVWELKFQVEARPSS